MAKLTLAQYATQEGLSATHANTAKAYAAYELTYVDSSTNSEGNPIATAGALLQQDGTIEDFLSAASALPKVHIKEPRELNSSIGVAAFIMGVKQLTSSEENADLALEKEFDVMLEKATLVALNATEIKSAKAAIDARHVPGTVKEIAPTAQFKLNLTVTNEIGKTKVFSLNSNEMALKQVFSVYSVGQTIEKRHIRCRFTEIGTSKMIIFAVEV